MATQQLTLNFEAGLTDSYGSCRELIAARVHQQGRPQKAIAADMDLSPSRLSRKLAQGDGDTSRLTLDDAETYMRVTGDLTPVYFWVEKYLTDDSSQIERLQAEIERLKTKRRR